MPKDLPADRLGLAKWLVDPGHPLTARVAVNRYWQMYFGMGIVKTAEDFGSQGDPPSHPELLDWLATEFMRTGWDVRAMQRLIVTSATYRQSSHVTPELARARSGEPAARAWAAFPAAGGDGARQCAGCERAAGREARRPSVFPYQPNGLWEEIAYGDVYSAQTYTPGHGEDLYRRSMYTFWKRTSPPPALITFDAPDREKCTARRAVTNTPLQALVLLNDPTYMEAARALAERMMNEGGADRCAASGTLSGWPPRGSPTPEEVHVLREIEREELEQYRRNTDAAAKLIGTGESKADPKLDATSWPRGPRWRARF